MTMQSSPWKQPPESMLAEEARLGELSAEFEERLREVLQNWEQEANDSIVATLEDLLQRAAADFDSEKQKVEGVFAITPVDPKARWRAACAFVDGVASNCVQPIRRYLTESHPVTALRTLGLSVEEQLLEATNGLPDRARLVFPADLLAHSGDSGLATTLRLARRKLRQQASVLSVKSTNVIRSVLNRPPRQLEHPWRTLSPVVIARDRVAASVVPLLRKEEQRLQDDLNRLLRSLERDVWSWTTAALKYLTASDRPYLRRPVGIRLGEVPNRRAKKNPESPADAPVPAPESPLADQTLECFRTASEVVVAPAGRPDVSEAMRLLRDDLRVGGTFLYKEPQPGGPSRHSSSEASGFSRDRIRLCASLLELNRRVRDAEDGLLNQIATKAIAPIERTYDSIKARLTELENEALATVRRTSGENPEVLADKLEALLGKSRGLESLYRDLPGLSAAEKALTEPGLTAWRSLIKFIATLPSDLRLRSVSGESTREFSADLLGAARSAFERPFPPIIAPAAEPLRRAISRVWNETDHIGDVVSNAITAATHHLREGTEEADPAATHVDNDEENIGDHIAAGLRRASDALEERYQSLSPEWDALIASLHKTLSSDWSTVFRAAQSEDALAKRLLSAQTRIARQADRAWSSVKHTWSEISTSGLAALRLLRLRVRNLIQIGQTAVGVSGTSTEDRNRALSAIASARKHQAELPLVYRRLFSPEPLTDLGLAQNREDDLRAVSDLVERWQSGLESGLVVVTAPLGAGRTTFLRLVEATCDGKLRAVRIGLAKRPEGESELAAQLAAALYPEKQFSGTLDDLEEVVRSRETSKSTLALVDNLELTLMLTAGGTRLLHRFLLFCIRTDHVIAWCCSCSQLAWHFVQKASPAAYRLATSHPLASWSRQALEGLVMKRHRRSGVPVEFSPPPDPSPLIRQRLRRAKSPQAEQRVLAGDYFDALTRSAGQSPARALFEWIRAGTFSADGEQLCIAPLKPLSFSHMQQFENDVAFALRHLLVHNVLTAREAATLFNLSLPSAVTLFETLLSEGLIESLDPNPGSVIVPDGRYQLHRLVLEPVVKSLRERHFVY